MEYNYYSNEICKRQKYRCGDCILRQVCLGYYLSETEKVNVINEKAYELYYISEMEMTKRKNTLSK